MLQKISPAVDDLEQLKFSIGKIDKILYLTTGKLLLYALMQTTHTQSEIDHLSQSLFHALHLLNLLFQLPARYDEQKKT